MSDNITSKKILIEVEAQTDSLHNSMTTASSAIDRLTKSQDQLTGSGKQNSQQFKDNAAMIELWQSRLSSATTQVDLNSRAVKSSTGTIEQNKAMVTALTAEKQKLAIGFADNSQKAQDLDAKISALTSTIAKQQGIMSAAEGRAETFGKAFQNVKTGVDGLSKVSGLLGSSLSAAAQTFEPLKSSLQTAVKVVEPFKSGLASANKAYANFRSGLASGQSMLSAFKNSSEGTKKAFEAFKRGSDTGKAAISGFKSGFDSFKKGISEGNGIFTSFSNGVKQGQSTFSSLTQGVNMGSASFKMLKVAIAETGIGLILLVVAALIEKLQECKPVMDMVNGAMAAIGAAVRVVIDTITGLVTSLSKLGDFIAHPIDSIMKLGTAMAKAAADAYNLAKAQEKLKNALSAQEVENAGLKENIDLLREKSKNGKLTVQQRLDALKAAGDAEKKYFEENKKLNDQERANAIEDARLKKGLSDDEIRALKERGTQYAQELLNEGKITQEQFDAIKKADLDIIALRKEHTESTRDLLSERQGIEDEAAAKKKQRQEEQRRQAAKLRQESEVERKKIENKKKEIADETTDAEEVVTASQLKLIKDFVSAKVWELSELDESYRQKISKYHDFITEYQNMNDQDKALNAAKMEAYTKAENQLTADQKAARWKIVQKFNKEAAAKILQDHKKLNEQLQKEDENNIIDAANPADKLVAEKKLIIDKYAYEIEQAKSANEDVTALEKQRDLEISRLDKQDQLAKTDLIKKAEQERKNFIIQTAQQVTGAAFSIISNGIKQATDAKIAGLEKDEAAELSNAALTSAQKLAIDQKYKKQEAQVKLKAFKEEKEASIAQAVINGAIAITKAESQTGVLGPLVIPGIIAETAIQIAKIAAQKPPAYAAGGLHYSSDGRGGVLSGYSKTDNTNAYLRSGEGIVVSEAMQVPWARNLVSAINVGFGGRDFSVTNPGRGYAVGGIFTDGGDANRYYNQPVHDQKNLANSIAYQMINNFPPVYVDVKDINNQQNILAQTINRVNL